MAVGSLRHLTAGLTLFLMIHAAAAARAAGEPGTGGGETPRPAVLVFGLGERCLSCLQLKQEIAKVREVTGDAVRFVDYRVDLERDREVVARYRVMLSPTLVFLDASGAEVFRQQGLMDAAQIREKLAALKLWAGKGEQAVTDVLTGVQHESLEGRPCLAGAAVLPGAKCARMHEAVVSAAELAGIRAQVRRVCDLGQIARLPRARAHSGG